MGYRIWLWEIDHSIRQMLLQALLLKLVVCQMSGLLLQTGVGACQILFCFCYHFCLPLAINGKRLTPDHLQNRFLKMSHLLWENSTAVVIGRSPMGLMFCIEAGIMGHWGSCQRSPCRDFRGHDRVSIKLPNVSWAMLIYLPFFFLSFFF
jgi:hypothetical protein